jgi:hypothetical protein
MTTLTMREEKRLEIIQRVFPRGELTVMEAADDCVLKIDLFNGIRLGLIRQHELTKWQILEIRGDDFHACSSQFQSFQAFNRFAPFKMFKSQRLGEGGDVSGILETSVVKRREILRGRSLSLSAGA